MTLSEILEKLKVGVPVLTKVTKQGIPYKVVLDIVKYIIDIAQTVIFQLFIFEEAIQTAGFGVFIAIQGKQWEQAERQLKVYEDTVKTAKTALAVGKMLVDFVTGLGIFGAVIFEAIEEVTGVSVPRLSYFLTASFESFFKAAEETAQAYRQRIAAEKAGLTTAEETYIW